MDFDMFLVSDKVGDTPLLIATKKGKQENVDFLVQCGADVNYCNHQSGKRAIDLAWENCYYDAVLTLIKADSTFPNIHDKPFKIESIINDTNVPEELKTFLNDRNNNSSLEQNEKLEKKKITDLAQVNKWDVVQWLVEHGTDINVQSNDGKTVLHWAAQGNLDVVEWLVIRGADVNVQSNDGKTVLHWAARGNLDVVQWLVEHGKANVDAKDNDGQTVLHWAAQENKWNIVQWLVEHGKVNVEATDSDGRTVLHWAARGNLDVVQWLVEHGADVNVKSNDGKTPLNLAEERKHKKMTEYLKKKIVESVGQVNIESAAMADVITVNGAEDFADLLFETREH